MLSRSVFPYYLLVALEADGLLRALALLLFVSFVYLNYVSVSTPLAVLMFVYMVMAGVRVRDIEAVAQSVLPRFYTPRLAHGGVAGVPLIRHEVHHHREPPTDVEPFARAFLSADRVIGTELEVDRFEGTTRPSKIMFDLADCTEELHTSRGFIVGSCGLPHCPQQI
ncbi:hypothetical protein D1007_15514 [Hordeum vulgare]|nr:hypothetical protein D1007_15514 [Hordeum vulgare]